jgi:acetylornithine/N-succinyldiaminopimelate aminotransferase
LLAGVRGSGLWLAMLLGEPVAPAAEAAFRDAGFLVNTVGPATLRLAPPLVLNAQQADQFLAAVPGVLNSLPAPGEVIRVTP